jgi:hypothetical protein
MNKSRYSHALFLARRIPLGANTPEKKKAVHNYIRAVKAMLNG